MLARGVDSQLFHPAKRDNALRESWALNSEQTAVLYVGRLAQDKNLGLLTRCFETLQDTYPLRQMKLIIVGDGPQRATLEKELPEAIFCGTLR
ncbi:glycosyltransferase, partial [Klebsiella pneumoniae]|uniref:glycosyltransferase n=1 Tax=Klebsiella pneumoniae TaxID=573 RepID=UPI0027302E37